MNTRGDQAYYNRSAGAVADYIYQELHIHPRRDYRITAATSGPWVLTLSLVVNPRHAPRITGLAEQLSMAAGLDRDQAVRVTRGSRGTLAIEIPKPASLRYTVPVRALPPRRGVNAAVGIDVEHRPASVDFANPLTPHLLLAGTTGSGKTNTARLFALDLVRQNTPDEVRLILIDTRKRGTAWRPFWSVPHLGLPVVIDDVTALRALAWCVAEIDRRSADGRTSPRVFVAIDEAQALLDRAEFVAAISDVARAGREFGIHLLLATQNPTADQIGSTDIKRNLTSRIIGKVDSAQAAVLASGIKATGAELLTGPGDQLLIQPDGVRRVATAFVEERDTADLPHVGADHVFPIALEGLDDIEHVLDQADNASKVAPVEPDHVAVALASGRGITWLAGELGIGAARAGRVKEFSDGVRAKLEDLAYTIIPLSQDVPPGSVTDARTGQVV